VTVDPFEPLETARLQLRCVSVGDAAATARLMTPHVSRWVANWQIPFTADMAAARIEAMRQLALKGEALPFAVLMKAERELIGWVMINRDGENPRRGSLGYWLGETYQGKGYMKEIAPVVLAAGFELLELDVIDAAAQLENTGSFAVMQACGMKLVREGKVYAPARKREELCFFYEIERPLSSR
jgi:ribosomal-protein-alanine N-acetyltransferase